MNRFEKGSPAAEKCNLDTTKITEEVFDRDFCSKLRCESTAAAATNCMLPRLELVSDDAACSAAKLNYRQPSDLGAYGHTKDPNLIQPGDRVKFSNPKDFDSGKTQQLYNEKVSKNFERIKQLSCDDGSPQLAVSKKGFEPLAKGAIGNSHRSEGRQEKETLLSHFARADKDGNNRISKNELNAHIGKMQEHIKVERNPYERDSINRDMTVLNRVNAKFDRISTASNDEFFFENGVSRRDLHLHARGDRSN